MPTFLTTRRMSPELRARVEASVRGERVVEAVAMRPAVVARIRFAVALTALALLVTVVLARQRVLTDVAGRRQALLGRWDERAAALDARQRSLPERVSVWLAHEAGAYPGDLVDDAVKGERLAALVLRPAIYVRGPAASFTTTQGTVVAATESEKDAFALCLANPPSERTEKALLARAKTAYAGGPRAGEAMRHVERLSDVLVGLRLLEPTTRARVEAADDARELSRLEREFERTPLEAMARGVRAEALWAVLDEPGTSGAPTELDGARPHEARVVLVDLSQDRLLLRVRRRLDPAAYTPEARTGYATPLDACALAWEAHQAARITGK